MPVPVTATRIRSDYHGRRTALSQGLDVFLSLRGNGLVQPTYRSYQLYAYPIMHKLLAILDPYIDLCCGVSLDISYIR